MLRQRVLFWSLAAVLLLAVCPCVGAAATEEASGSLMKLALVAGSENSDRDVAVWRVLWRQRVADIRRQLPLPSAAAAFDLLRAQVLTGEYRADCPSLQETLGTGDYNCVTATVLYVCLCRELGLSAEARATEHHVFARVSDTSGQPGDVQTTALSWSEATAANTEAALARTLTEQELVAKLYYNRAVTALERRQANDAVKWSRLAQRLDPQHAAAEANLLASLNNAALAQADAGDFSPAAALVYEALQRQPAYSPALANDVHIHQQWAQHLCRIGRQEEARALLARCARRRPTEPRFEAMKVAIGD